MNVNRKDNREEIPKNSEEADKSIEGDFNDIISDRFHY
jgi:hypothetical protein